jgi:hypothetical protein
MRLRSFTVLAHDPEHRLFGQGQVSIQGIDADSLVVMATNPARATIMPTLHGTPPRTAALDADKTFLPPHVEADSYPAIPYSIATQTLFGKAPRNPQGCNTKPIGIY